jgi:hypothetical protein
MTISLEEALLTVWRESLVENKKTASLEGRVSQFVQRQNEAETN